MGFEFVLGKVNDQCDYIIEEEERDLYFLWIKLPINVVIKRFFNVKSDTITYNFEQGKAGAYLLLEQKENEIFKDAAIISRTDMEKIKDNKYIINADYICLMNIAKEQPIESDVPWKNTDDLS